MKKSALVSLFVAAPLMAAPLTWETLVQSADQDVRYQASQKRANIATSRSTKLWNKLCTKIAVTPSLMNCPNTRIEFLSSWNVKF